MNNYFVKFGFLTTTSLLAITYAPGTSCSKEKQQEDKVKQVDQPKVDDVDSPDSWDNIFTEMHKNFEKMQQRMEKDFKTATNCVNAAFDQEPMPSLSITSDKNAIIIKMSGVTGDNVEATTRDNERLTVKTPEATLELAIHDDVLHAQITQEQKNEEEKDGAKKHFASLNYAESYQTIMHELDLDNTKVKFDEKNKTLVITIPTVPEKAGKKLAVEKATTKEPAQEK